MDFIVKDLMISVLPLRRSSEGGFGGGGRAAGCEAGACTPCSDCSRCTLVTPGGLWERYLQVSNPADIALLKQQLREALAVVEAREKVVHQEMRPTSAAEIGILQSHLEAALDELRRTAKELT